MKHRSMERQTLKSPGTSSMLRAAGVLTALVYGAAAGAAQVVLSGPSGSSEFGSTVTLLPNGNFVVTDPGFDAPGPIVDVGAVYLYRADGVLISTLTGSTAGDRVGRRVFVLSTGNFVVTSPSWSNGAASSAGAATFGSATSGVNGVVSPANSLVGSTANDGVGIDLAPLSNGNYVVESDSWNNGAATRAGAATFGSGSTGVNGVVSPANSLVGSSTNDRVGDEVVALSNGNYVVRSPSWANGAATSAGAVTFASGTSGISGVVSPANSLVGGAINNRVGSDRVTALGNGNYVVRSLGWDSATAVDVGAVTFGSGTGGITGVVSAANSLVGSTSGDRIGREGITELSNHNYVVRSPDWTNGAVDDAGAVTFGSGTTGVSGVVSPLNSLVGSSARDEVGDEDVVVLANGNYVVCTPAWDNGAAFDAGAATFGSGTAGISGAISWANSLVGTTARDFICDDGITELSNGNYVVASDNWDNGATADVGAVTFGSGISGISGVVSPANSLIGSTVDDRVGTSDVTALSNGNYVVGSVVWNNGTVQNAGAATFGSGTSGIIGVVSPANSLVGASADDFVGADVIALSNGNYVVGSKQWRNGTAARAGAATFGSGTTGISGVVSPANSLVGSSESDSVGSVIALSNGNYVVISSSWTNGTVGRPGAVTFGSGTSGVIGAVSPANSLVGTTAGDRVGEGGVTELSSGDYVVSSTFWDNGAATDAGAVTFASGINGLVAVVSPTNSLVGTTSNDRVGSEGITALSNGNYLVDSQLWDNGAATDAGAISLGLGGANVVGPLTTEHSVLGLVANQAETTTSAYDPQRNQLIVGQPASNRVVLHRSGIATQINIVGSTPNPSEVGQPVTFTALLSALPTAPSDGQVTFRASSGESCTDSTASAVSLDTVEFSCALVFATLGPSTVIAEYTGSIVHAYSGSAPEPHTTGAAIFVDGFEAP